MSIEKPEQKRVLIIAHDFPPLTGGRVMRMLKLVKYLPSYGWHPVVLTIRPEDHFFASGEAIDSSLLDEIPSEAQVIRTSSPLERHLRALVYALRRSTRPTLAAQPSNESQYPQTMRNRIAQYLLKYRVTQDQSGLWFPVAYKTASYLIARNHVQAVITTSPPHLLQPLGVLLKRRTGVPWISDFRDGWSDNVLFRSEATIRQRVDQWLERRVINNADYVTVVTKHMLANLKSRYPEHDHKFRLIYNGYDSDDFSGGIHRSHSDRAVVSFAHFGNMGRLRDPSSLFVAMQQLIDEGQLSREEIRFELVGRYHGDAEDVPSWVDMVPPVEHRRATEMMNQAGVLLLIASESEKEAAFTSKVFEYLAAERPILAVAPEKGELADLMQAYTLGTISSAMDLTKLKRAIMHAHTLAKQNALPSAQDKKLVAQYDRYYQAGLFASLLDSVTEQ